MNNPKWIRCYDNGGESADRYTVVFTRLQGKYSGCYYLAMSSYPFHPQGIGLHCEHSTMIDRPKYSHLGKKIDFSLLPDDCKKLVLSDYKDFWPKENLT